ncbi:MAG: DUF1214 domain-containing protein [Henriciella sp.]|nr:DUF1214 domain-containing protein [Henriciella sp.]
MGRVLKLLLVAVMGVLVGAGSAVWLGGLAPGGPRIGNALDIDDWRSDWSIGSETANPYVRARVARNGLMGLRKEEAVYFIKTVDDTGRPLRDTCIYRVSGGGFPAAWWSITLYDAANMLPMNEDNKLSFDQTQAEYIFQDAEAEWMFQVSPTPPSDVLMPWVSSQAGGKFDLMLRLYQPEDDLLATPETALFPPHIQRLSCAGEMS